MLSAPSIQTFARVAAYNKLEGLWLGYTNPFILLVGPSLIDHSHMHMHMSIHAMYHDHVPSGIGVVPSWRPLPVYVSQSWKNVTRSALGLLGQ